MNLVINTKVAVTCQFARNFCKVDLLSGESVNSVWVGLYFCNRNGDGAVLFVREILNDENYCGIVL